ncbi:MAG: hypothetical protein ACQESH_05655 [Campylobacterota bacterium]
MDYQRILKDCFWDMNFDSDKIEKILQSNDIRQKSFLFEKILLNSTRLFNDLAIFEKGELEFLLDNYKIPRFNGDYAFKRKNMAEVYFFDKPLLIDELKWIA